MRKSGHCSEFDKNTKVRSEISVKQSEFTMNLPKNFVFAVRENFKFFQALSVFLKHISQLGWSKSINGVFG